MANSAEGKTWYLAQIKPNCAAIARANLQRQGIATFHPFELRSNLRAGRHVSTKAPLFPGYIFVALDPQAAQWRQVNSTLGVTSLVSFGTCPAAVPGAIMEALMRRCDAHGMLVELAQLSAGDRVRITNGPLADFMAQVERIDSSKRVWLLMDVMGGKARVALPQADLRLAS